MSFDRETGRDRYFAARERELAALVDPATGRLAADLGRPVDCPLCGSDSHRRLFDKEGFTFVRCEECGLVFVNPQPNEALVEDGYRTAQTNDLWFEVLTSERQQALDRDKFAAVLDALERSRGEGRLLDVGCSTGLFLELARERGWRTTGLELAPRALAHARERGLDVRDVPLAQAAFEPASFDAVALLSVLEHANDPRALLDDVRRVLRPGGALYVIVPNVESLACRVLHERARTFDGRNHLVYFSPATLPRMLAEAGFEVDNVTTRIGSLDAILRWLRYDDPYGDAAVDDRLLGAWLGASRDHAERALEQSGLGYKLHCVARMQLERPPRAA